VDKIFCHRRKNIFPQKQWRFLLVNMYKLLFVNAKKPQKRIQTFSLKCIKKQVKNSLAEVFLRQAVLNLII